jgi:hypothetical protein
MQPLEQAGRDVPRPAFLIRQFHHALSLQNRRDAETLASLTRMFRNPRSAQAEQFIKLLAATVRQELHNERS